jgi:hypothetical protein
MKKILLIVCCFFSFIPFGNSGTKETVQVSKKDFKECVDIYKKIDVAYKPTTVQITKYLTNTNFFDKYGKDKKDPIIINKSDLDNILQGLQMVITQSETDSAFKRKKVNGKVIILKERVNETGKIDALKSKISDTKIFIPIPTTSGSVSLNKQTKAKIDSLNSDINILNVENAKLLADKELYKMGCLLMLALLGGLIGIGIWMNRNASEGLKREIKSLQIMIEEQREHYTKTIKELEAKSREGKSTFREAVSTVEIEKDVIIPIEEPKKIIVPEPPKTPENTRQFYLSTPAISSDGQGFFDGSEVYNSATALSSLYEFVLDNDKRSADFKFLNTPNNVHDSLKFPDRYIQPACEYSGLNSKATKIITTKAGRALKDGNNWKIIKKAEIRFE